MNQKKAKAIRRNVVKMIYQNPVSNQEMQEEMKDKKTKSMMRGAKKNYTKGDSPKVKIKISKRQLRIEENKNNA